VVLLSNTGFVHIQWCGQVYFPEIDISTSRQEVEGVNGNVTREMACLNLGLNKSRRDF